MRIALVTPPLTLAQRYGVLAEAGGVEPPIGLCYLAASLRSRSIPSRIVDASAENMTLEQAADAVLRLNPEVVGISSTTVSIHAAAELAKLLKAKRNKLKTIIGGVHVTSLPMDTMSRFESFDIGVIGEGEETIVELLDALQGGEGLSGVHGIAYRENGDIALTAPRAYIAELDRLPKPAWDLLQGFPGLYSIPIQSAIKYPSSSLITSRGCTGKCTFCDRNVFGNRCREHSGAYVFEMMEELHKKYGIRDIHFEDDNFLLFPRRLDELCRRLIEAKLDLSWSVVARPDMVRRDKLELMKKAGCWQILFGIESGNQELLDSVKKGVRLEQIEEAVRSAKNSGLKTKGFFMLGFPGETKETVMDTVRFFTRIPLDDMSATFFTPFPGTEIYREVRRYGTLIDDWSRMSVFEPVFIPHGFTPQQLAGIQKKMIRAFYLRPKVIMDYLRRGIQHRQLGTMARTALRVAGGVFLGGK